MPSIAAMEQRNCSDFLPSGIPAGRWLDAVSRRRDVHLSSKWLAFLVANLAGGSGVARFKMGEIADMAGVHPDTARDRLRDLKRIGLLTMRFAPGSRSLLVVTLIDTEGA